MLARAAPECDATGQVVSLGRPDVAEPALGAPEWERGAGGELLVINRDAAGANAPFYDLAAVAVFLQMDDATSAQLIAAHDQAPVAAQLPARFIYLRHMVAALCGPLFLHIAHAGARGHETFDLAPTLGDVHERMRAGAINTRTPDGQWQFGQALLKRACSCLLAPPPVARASLKQPQPARRPRRAVGHGLARRRASLPARPRALPQIPQVR